MGATTRRRKAVAPAILVTAFFLIPADSLQCVDSHAQTGKPKALVRFATETTINLVPFVKGPWEGTDTPPRPSSSQVARRPGTFPGFAEAKRLANEKAAKRPATAPTLTRPPSEAPAITSGAVWDGPSKSDTPWIPPDPVLAAGPNHVAIAINSLLAVYTKAGARQGSYMDLSAFFAGLGLAGEIFDPRIVYDQVHNRFILTAAELNLSNFSGGHVVIAVSQTSDPTGIWYKFALDFRGRNLANTADTLPDFPTMGLSSTALYISTGQFVINQSCMENENCAFSDTWIRVIGINELLAGNPSLTVTTFKNVHTASGDQAFVVQPAVTYGAASQEFLVAADASNYPGRQLNLFAINTSGTPTLSAADLDVPGFYFPPDAPQQQSTTKIATNDPRLLNAVWRDGSLWSGHNVADAAGVNSAARWYEVALTSLNTAQLRQVGNETGVGNAYYPALAALADGTVGMVFTTSSANYFASAAYTGRTAPESLNTMRPYAVYKAGTAPYNDFDERWGDYSCASPDPAGDSIWMIAELAGSPDPHFETAVIQAAAPPGLQAEPSSVNFPPQDYATTSPPQTLTLRNVGSGTLGITGLSFVQDSGYGQFAISADQCSGAALATAETCKVDLTFTPLSTSEITGTLEVSYSASEVALRTTIRLSGGAIAGVPVVSPTQLVFPDTPSRTSSPPQSVTLTNVGNAPLRIIQIAFNFLAFRQTNNCPVELAGGGSCVIDISFQPSGESLPTSMYLYIVTTAPGGSLFVDLVGNAVNKPLVTLCPARTDFANQVVGTTSTAKTIYVSNTGLNLLTISSISASGDFSATSTCPGSVPASSACTVNITFHPGGTGTRTGSLTIVDDAPGSPHVMPLSGTGVSAVAKINTEVAEPKALLTQDTSSPEATPSSAIASDFRNYGKIPLQFEANRGQFASAVRFSARGPGYSTFLTDYGALIVLGRRAKSKKRAETAVLQFRLLGSNPEAWISGIDELPGKSNYFRGRNPEGWHTSIPNYARVHYTDIYPGIGLEYYGNERQLEYDFVVAPGADPGAIRFSIKSIGSPSDHQEVRIEENGDLVVPTRAGDLRLRKPRIYQRQEHSDRRQAVDGRYVIKPLLGQDSPAGALPGIEVALTVGPYDKSRALLIDPVLSYATLLGGTSGDTAAGVAVDKDGNAYVVGTTTSPDFPVVNAVQPVGSNTYQFITDVFVAKLNPSGSGLVYATYLGGELYEEAVGIAVDMAGEAYVAGNTSSKNFPVKGGLATDYLAGFSHSFITKLDATGSAIVYSAVIGGNNEDRVQALAVDGEGGAYIAGFTQSTDYPTTPGALQRTPHYSTDAFVTKIDSSGSFMAYSTYLGGSDGEGAYGLAVDSGGNAYVSGPTNSPDFPVTDGALQVVSSGYYNTGYVAKLNPTGTGLVYSTYLDNQIGNVVVDSQGHAYVRSGPYAGQYVAKLHPAGCALESATRIEEFSSLAGQTMALDDVGRIYLTGWVDADPFPLVNPIQSTGRPWIPFVAWLGQDGHTVEFSTYLGGTEPGYTGSADFGQGIAVDASGNIYVVGVNTTGDFPIVGGLQPRRPGNGDAFVAKISPANLPAVSLTHTELTFADQPVNSTSPNQDVVLRNMGTGALGISSITMSGEFSQTNTCGSNVSGGGYCVISVSSRPLSAAPKTGTITITDTAFGSPHLITLSGQGIDAPYGVLSPSLVDFGSVLIGGNAVTRQVTFQNTGNLPMTVSAIEVVAGYSGDAFTQANDCPSALAPGGQCTITATYTPTQGGGAYSTIRVTDDAPNSPQEIPLQGIGVRPPTVRLQGSGVRPQYVIVGAGVNLGQVIVSNIGDLPLEISGIGGTEEFPQSNNCPAVLNPGNSCFITVKFVPAVTGLRTGSITITDNAPDSPQVFPLTSTGWDFSVAAAPSTASVSPGQSAKFTLRVTPSEGIHGSVLFSCSGLPSYSECTFVPYLLSDEPSDPVDVAVTVTTRAASSAFVNWPNPPDSAAVGFALIMILLLVPYSAIRQGWRRLVAASLAASLFAVLLLASCGGGGGGGGGGGADLPPGSGGGGGTPSGDYVVTISAGASFNQARSATVQLKVQ